MTSVYELCVGVPETCHMLYTRAEHAVRAVVQLMPTPVQSDSMVAVQITGHGSSIVYSMPRSSILVAGQQSPGAHSRAQPYYGYHSSRGTAPNAW